MEFKDPLLPHPLHSTVGGGGLVLSPLSAALKNYLIKTWITLTLSSKWHGKWYLIENPRNKKVCYDIEAFFICKKNILLKASRIYLRSKYYGTFGPPDLSIRVKSAVEACKLFEILNILYCPVYWFLYFQIPKHSFPLLSRKLAEKRGEKCANMICHILQANICKV
jgi:hypothetical protein